MRSTARTGRSCAWNSGDGWFNRWAENVIRRDAQDLADCVRELFELGGSINLYMFHGGTSFGFMNGVLRASHA